VATSNRRSLSRTKHNRRRILGIAAVAASVLALASAPANAQSAEACIGTAASTVCLALTQIDADHYEVHIGLDVVMSIQDAQKIIDAPGDPLSAEMLQSRESLFVVPLTDVEASEPGLVAGFDVDVTRSQLGIPGRGVHGRIKLADPVTHTTRIFETPGIAVRP
jgi:hypothetical protein